MTPFKKTINTTATLDYVKCDVCGAETPFYMAIDTWGKHEGETYCLLCQEKYKVISFDPERSKKKKEEMSENIFKVGEQAPPEFDALWQGKSWAEMQPFISPGDVLSYGVRRHEIPDQETADRLWEAYQKWLNDKN